MRHPWTRLGIKNSALSSSCALKVSLLCVLTISFLTFAPLCLVQGVLHTVAGYLLYTSLTFKCVFDYHPEDVYWCTADIGWITGHSYVTYGPLANGATSVLVSFFFLPVVLVVEGFLVGTLGEVASCWLKDILVFLSSLRVFRSTLTSAASGKSLRSIKCPNSTQHPQLSACS